MLEGLTQGKKSTEFWITLAIIVIGLVVIVNFYHNKLGDANHGLLVRRGFVSDVVDLLLG